ncbi:NADH:ubiquinone oxidoreductase complex I intermediate-associated protein 30 [Aspergillus steynii IBT 23096]|uniref:NADH:ubiquinone oxidoreductase complex I intermediate-associated protein 30 n=1 Tax=Aspergillus steynii IBT 23096 TaxID=1392250 RepID=A0A2I2FS27_9EURO|nr:NADH:ubiquinone oxidoreductase complex I intermediate-associated protein 30 [Aspergillus steynii IBT 23096]PLB43438.1 NADH:ubiquinone oxidoreductase complex I intermediate-associated protein 30 [Aspergillus steynii IBT 23096]
MEFLQQLEISEATFVMASNSKTYIFGGDQPWSPHDWTASDDRVRGGASHSYLECDPPSNAARFHGHLDIHALGGAGFASQRTTGDRMWDLTGNDGLELDIRQSDGKKYTLTLKDTVLPKRPDGREQSTINWEYDFHATDKGPFVIRWKDFRATYRGKDKEDAPPLDRSSIKRISIMMRSFFGTQEGDFSLEIASIAAIQTEN